MVIALKVKTLHIVLNGSIWKRRVEQLRPGYGVEEDDDPGKVPVPSLTLHPHNKDSSFHSNILPSNKYLFSQAPVQYRRYRSGLKGRRNFQPPLPGHLKKSVKLPRRSECLLFLTGGEVL